MSDKVYLGPLLGYVEPNLRAVDARCREIADAVVRAVEERADRPHPLFACRATLRWSPPANHDPGDEDRR